METKCVLVWCLLWCTVAGNDRLYGLNLMCPPEVGPRCQANSFSKNEYFYTINGFKQRIDFTEGIHFMMACTKIAMDDSALPRFSRAAPFRTVRLRHCALPAADASYAGALRRLNVTVVERLVLENLPAAPPPTAFADLPPTLAALEIYGAGRAPLALAPGTLDRLEHVRRLTLRRVRPARLPPRLTSLTLNASGLDRLPEPLGADLDTLSVVEDSPRNLSALAALTGLRDLRLSAPLATLPPLPPGLVNLSLARVADASLAAQAACSRLRRLVVEGGRAPAAGWLAPCAGLEALTLRLLARGARLPAGLLRGAARLRELHVTWNALDSLPSDLLEYSPYLTEVDLSHNRLETIPRSLFTSVAGSVQRLDLSANRLSAAAACAAARPLLRLTSLSLANNPLGDLCPQPDATFITGGNSCLVELVQLQYLSLARTGAVRVCGDWLRALTDLARLDLTHNNITYLKLYDLNRMKRSRPSDVDVMDNPLAKVDADEDDYDKAAQDLPASQGTVLINSELQCDCTAFWLAKALKDGRVAVKMEPRCEGGARLRTVPLSSLVCAVEAETCAPCSCEFVPLQGGLRAVCGQEPPAHLLKAPPQPLKHLQLRGAGLTELPSPLPSGMLFLDLDNNSISRFPSEEGVALFASVKLVRLTDNPLACDCQHDSPLPILSAHRDQLLDLNDTMCDDGRRLVDALDAECPVRWASGATALIVLGIAALAALALAALLTRAEPRLRLKAWLHARGVRGRWLWKRLEPADAGRLFDAFLSHAPALGRFVGTTLQPVLEKRGYKLCIKERDWPPGAWIPSQIEASVAASRRTIAVVGSPADNTTGPDDTRPIPTTADAGWADAELRAAHAASLREKRPRLVIIVRGELPPDLKEIARSHLCLRWGERCFWEKLFYALPDPMVPPDDEEKKPIA